MEKENEEIWKTIEDYPNYEVSSFGNIKNKTTKKLLKLQKNYSGYLKVSLLNNNKKSFSCIVHRLVAKAFIHNTEHKSTVNHIDRNRSNNHIRNLEWSTMSEQNYHSALVSQKGNPNNCRDICQINIETNKIIREFISIRNAAIWIIDNNLTHIKEKNDLFLSIISSKICAVANNKRNNAYNFKWKYIIKDDIENEIWNEIPFEIVDKYNYLVSNFGRFKNNKKQIKMNHKSDSGYKRLSINKKTYLLHRLVALTFLENPENKEFVNHKDGNKLNNLLENLEWATCLENNMHKIDSGLSNCTKKVIQYDSNMDKLNEYNSIVECAKALNVSASCVSNNCSGKYKSAKCGYIFRYAE
jgi:hypothetical protein